MAVNADFLRYVLDQLAGLGRVTARRMFGGVGLYYEERFFGLIAGDTLYLKVNDSNRSDYEARSMSRFRPFPDKPYWSMTYYELPADLIAQAPADPRDSARLLTLDRATGELGQRTFRDLPELLAPGDLLVLNDSRVLHARLLGHRQSTGGRWEGLFLRAFPDGTWELMAKTGGKPSPGEAIAFLRGHGIAITWNPAAAALQAHATETAKTVTVKAS